MEILGPSRSHRVGGRVEFNPKEGTSKNSGREASEAAIRQKWKEEQKTADPADDDIHKMTQADVSNVIRGPPLVLLLNSEF